MEAVPKSMEQSPITHLTDFILSLGRGLDVLTGVAKMSSPRFRRGQPIRVRYCRASGLLEGVEPFRNGWSGLSGSRERKNT